MLMDLRRVSLGQSWPTPKQPQLGALSQFGGAWEDWCVSSEYGSDPELLKKCQEWGPAAPWTVVGKVYRGLPVDVAAWKRAAGEVAATAGQLFTPETQEDPPSAAGATTSSAAAGSSIYVPGKAAKESILSFPTGQSVSAIANQAAAAAAAGASKVPVWAWVAGVGVAGVALLALSKRGKRGAPLSGYRRRRRNRRNRR